ncbi:ORF6N domain-containing protein, partial [Candidatus Falkowbacteria bacterium]|nr:ORF6N domain-containing protein [Candidatus Falkowbacteria bacterium]
MIPFDRIESKILRLRGQKVMMDYDLAVLYGVETKKLNQAVKRNLERFPDDFMFHLTKDEANLISRFATLNLVSRSQFVTLNGKNSENKQNSRSQFATLKTKHGKNIKYLPYAFTEQGVAMLSSVLKSKRAVEVNIAIMRIFVNIRKFISSYEGLAMKIAELEKKYDVKIGRIMNIIDQFTPLNNFKFLF